MKKSELRLMIREMIPTLREDYTGKNDIVAIYPGENKKNPYMFYFEDQDDKQVYYVAGRGKIPVAIADDLAEFKTKVKKGKVRAELI